MSNSIERSSATASSSTTAAAASASASGASPAAAEGTSSSISGGGSSVSPGGPAVVCSGSHRASSSSVVSPEEPSWSRRGLERLSGLKEFGFEVLSRRQRHERDKSGGTSSSRSQDPVSAGRRSLSQKCLSYLTDCSSRCHAGFNHCRSPQTSTRRRLPTQEAQQLMEIPARPIAARLLSLQLLPRWHLPISLKGRPSSLARAIGLLVPLAQARHQA